MLTVAIVRFTADTRSRTAAQSPTRFALHQAFRSWPYYCFGYGHMTLLQDGVVLEVVDGRKSHTNALIMVAILTARAALHANGVLYMLVSRQSFTASPRLFCALHFPHVLFILILSRASGPVVSVEPDVWRYHRLSVPSCVIHTSSQRWSGKFPGYVCINK